MHEDGRTGTDAEVRAATERWARAAGVSPAVAYGGTVRTPVTVRFLRGLLLGLAVGALLVVVASALTG